MVWPERIHAISRLALPSVLLSGTRHVTSTRSCLFRFFVRSVFPKHTGAYQIEHNESIYLASRSNCASRRIRGNLFASESLESKKIRNRCRVAANGSSEHTHATKAPISVCRRNIGNRERVLRFVTEHQLQAFVPHRKKKQKNKGIYKTSDSANLNALLSRFSGKRYSHGRTCLV